MSKKPYNQLREFMLALIFFTAFSLAISVGYTISKPSTTDQSQVYITSTSR